jgi:hypothetical protein
MCGSLLAWCAGLPVVLASSCLGDAYAAGVSDLSAAAGLGLGYW